ncbi:polysaccharide export protein [Aliivibrio finisterrensis]|uniref:Polysaccharide export protein n=1 Tax=Aliivibrio finisterrensis TaxID=511998 RepID=A0A4V1Z7P9_9GAMM|nr:polysaccharide biosynthesis/export family protein [Aliivibrio finisterrensis]RYU46101.1 polysaccharide export protein [Aliivibrio finisterrensis]
MARISTISLWLMFLMAISFKSIAINNNYTIGAGDKIQISVYGEENLSIDELYIDNSGTFEYPYLGQLRPLNKTTEQLQNEIINGLKGDYLISPKVRISIIGFRSIYVNGEVKKPGGYEYQPGLTVDKAIALAGGFTDRAARKNVYIAQAGKDDLKNKVKLSSSVSPGDIIVIEQSFF